MWLARQVDATVAHVFPTEEAAETWAENNVTEDMWTIWKWGQK
jgi:hypothetical protein